MVLLTVCHAQSGRDRSDKFRWLCRSEAACAADASLDGLSAEDVGVVKADDGDGLGFEVEGWLGGCAEVRG